MTKRHSFISISERLRSVCFGFRNTYCDFLRRLLRNINNFFRIPVTNPRQTQAKLTKSLPKTDNKQNKTIQNAPVKKKNHKYNTHEIKTQTFRREEQKRYSTNKNTFD